MDEKQHRYYKSLKVQEELERSKRRSRIQFALIIALSAAALFLASCETRLEKMERRAIEKYLKYERERNRAK